MPTVELIPNRRSAVQAVSGLPTINDAITASCRRRSVSAHSWRHWVNAALGVGRREGRSPDQSPAPKAASAFLTDVSGWRDGDRDFVLGQA